MTGEQNREALSPFTPEAAREQEKWDREYASLELAEEGPGLKAFNLEFLGLVSELLPDGGKVLEAGCGAGWQSLALARTGKYDVHLLDVSREALNYTRRVFEREGLRPALIHDDAMAEGRPEFDLVFNAGVLEHYTQAQQAALVKGMKSRSREYVLTLVPNRHCYWYWLWRVLASAGGRWTFGKEVPVSDLSAVFEAAGLQLLGQAYVGADWTEQLISGLDGMSADLRRVVLEVHRSPILAASAKGYLLASLGSVAGVAQPVPAAWNSALAHEVPREPELLAALSDALAMRMGAESEVRELRAMLEERRELQESDRKLRALEGQVRDRDAQLDELQRERGSLAVELDAARTERDGFKSRYDEVHQWAETLTGRLDSQVQQTLEFEARLQAITSGTGWAVLQKMYAVRYFLFPRHSRRERLGRYCMEKLRRARFHASHGPRAFAGAVCQAVRRGLSPSGRGARIGERARHGEGKGLTTSTTASPIPEAAQAAACEVAGLVSVILPVYNHAALLREAVESVLAQTYRDFELLLLNDGSTDETEAVLRSYVGHPNVRVLTQANQKLPKALSNAFAFARGEFFTWTSADNLMEPQQLERMVAFLREHPDVAIDDRGEPLRDPAFRPQNKRRPDSPEIHLPRDPGPINTVDDNFIGACFLYRGWVGRVIGEYAPELGCEDYDYWMRINALFRIAHLGTDEILYRYRVHDNTLSGRARELRISERVRALMQYERRRSEFYARPWNVFVDAPTEAQMARVNRRSHVVRPLAAMSEAVENPDKRLVLVSADSLDDLPEAARGDDVRVAIWFDGTSGEPYRRREALRTVVDVCFCADQETAARADLFNRNVFVARTGQAMFDIAVAFANNDAFYRATVSAETRRRQLPEPLPASGERSRVLVQVDHYAAGGLEQVVLDLLSVLGEEGFDLSLVVLGQAGANIAKVRQLGIEVLIPPTKHREMYYRDILRERRIGLVNGHFSLFGARIAAEAGIPFIQTVHSCYISMPQETVAAYRANDRYTSAYICTSSNTAFYADLKMGLPPARMILGPNGVNRERLAVSDPEGARSQLRSELGLAADDFVFLHVGSIYRDKAQKLIVDALADVRREHTRAKLVCVGRSMDGRYLAELKEDIHRRGLQTAVVLAPFREDVAPFYVMADAFVLPSFWEGWSLSLAEALCMRLPVIATAVGSAPDLLPRLGGHLLRPAFDSILDLDAHTVERYLDGDHGRLVADMAAAMRQVCEDPSPPKVDDAVLASLDHRAAYRLYARLFRWILQSGSVGAARAWSR
jgi:glycosyltransferase involved in cell wall biosynthesis/SAM-dependent methyltransferase